MKADITASRHRGNKSSDAAFLRSKGQHHCDRELIWHLLRRHPFGLTAKEIAEKLGKPLHAISGRLSQLKQADRIVGTKERRDGSEIVVSLSNQRSVFDQVPTASESAMEVSN